VQQAERIALYLANDAELSLQPFIQWCWQQNKQVYLPVLHPFCSGYLLFLQYQPNSQMAVNKYNIAEPKLNVNIVCPATQLDIIFTPLVAFDHKGERLGMGGGFYDRTLAYVAKHQLSAENSTKIIGLAHDCQQVESVPTESWDIPLPEIYTPTQHFSF
jgi:5-formyltetrahydrofolate cyclo-ligase